MVDPTGVGTRVARIRHPEGRIPPAACRNAGAAFLLLLGSACATASGPGTSALRSAQPLTEAEIGIVTAIIDIADRRDFEFSLFADAASATNPEVRRQTAYAAARIGGAGGRSIARHLLADRDSTVAAVAAFALGELADSSSVAVLSERLLVRDSTFAAPVAVEAAEALGKIANEEAVATLRGFLVGADSADIVALPGVIVAALLAGWRAGIADVGPFARWADSPSPEIRWSAVYALTRRPQPEAVPLLQACLEDVDGRVRSLALRGLHRSLVEEAGASSTEIVTAVRGLLEDSVYAVRIEAIRALATYSLGPALDAVVQVALTGKPHERVAALEALGQAGENAVGASGAILGIALDPAAHPFLREVAAEALAAVDPVAAAENLPTLLGEGSWRLRAAAGRALASLPSLDYSAIVPAARDPDSRVAAATVLALSEREDSASIRSVRSLLIDAFRERDIQLRAAALDAAARIADPTLFSLFLDAYDRALSDSIPDARLAAVDAIASLKDHGIPFPGRAFFARFPESSEYLVRQRVVERFGGEVRNTWRPPLSHESGPSRADIEGIVRRWIAPGGREAGLSRPRVLVQTDRGDLVLELFPEQAPLTVANFLDLARFGFFDGQEWPRIVPNFVVQGGDARGDTSGSIGHMIRDEMNRHRYEAGTLGMALSGPDTGGSQFFITHTAQPHLNGTYTVFGRLLSGQPVIEQLMVGDRILRVSEVPRQMAQ